MKMTKAVLHGIYSLEILNCKCKIKRYRGGKCILERDLTCEIHLLNKRWFVCPKCGIKGSKKFTKNHQWEHAV